MKTFNFSNLKNVAGEVDLICSKSILQRLLIFGSFYNQNLQISNVSLNDDIKACMESMNVINNNIVYDESCQSINIVNTNINYNKEVTCNVNNSGTTFRMLSTILTTFDHHIKIDANEQMRSRSIENLYEISPSISKSWPLEIVKNTYDEIVMDASVSSQYISGMIMAMCLFNKSLKIYITNPSSVSYIELTIDVCKQFGFDIVFENNLIYLNDVKQHNISNIHAQGDWTHGVNWLVLKHFYPQVKILNLVENSKQADVKVLDIILNYQKYDVLDANLFIDSIPILCLFFALKNKPITFYNTKRLMFKESNRITSTITTLKKFNVNIDYIDDKIIVGNSCVEILENVFDSFDDHRICFLVVIGALILKKDISLNNELAINKSYPQFYKQVFNLIKE